MVRPGCLCVALTTHVSRLIGSSAICSFIGSKRNGLLGPELELTMFQYLCLRRNISTRHPTKVFEQACADLDDRLCSLNNVPRRNIYVLRHSLEHAIIG